MACILLHVLAHAYVHAKWQRALLHTVAYDASCVAFFEAYFVRHDVNIRPFAFCVFLAWLFVAQRLRACVRVKRLHLSDHHWNQALVRVVATRNCPASCRHAYVS